VFSGRVVTIRRGWLRIFCCGGAQYLGVECGSATHLPNDTAAVWQKKLPNAIGVMTAVVVGATAIVLG